MKFKKALYWTVIVVGFGNFLLWTPMAIVDIIQGQYTEANPREDTRLSILIGIIMGCGLVPLLAGALASFKLYNLQKTHTQKSQQQLMDRLFKLAGERGGKLTILETAGELNLSLEAANTVLSGCIQNRLAELQVSDSGILVYHFTQFISDDEKNSAETV